MTKREKHAKMMRREARKAEKKTLEAEMEERYVNSAMDILLKLLTEVYTEEDKKNWTDEDYMNCVLTASMLAQKGTGLYDGSITISCEEDPNYSIVVK